jgi:hypothetical protein
MSDNIKNENKDFKSEQPEQQPKMENKKDKPKREFDEKRSGEDRRRFSFGYQGPERRKSSGRRRQDKPPE